MNKAENTNKKQSLRCFDHRSSIYSVLEVILKCLQEIQRIEV